LYVIDRPKTYLLAGVLGAVALLAVGAIADGMLRASRDQVCEAPPAATPQQEAPPPATGGSADGPHVRDSSPAT